MGLGIGLRRHLAGGTTPYTDTSSDAGRGSAADNLTFVCAGFAPEIASAKRVGSTVLPTAVVETQSHSPAPFCWQLDPPPRTVERARLTKVSLPERIRDQRTRL